MAIQAGPLPDNIDELKKMIKERDATISSLTNKLTWAEEKLEAMITRLFGPSTEKNAGSDNDKQAMLFDEAEACADESSLTVFENSVVKEHDRKKKGRKSKNVQLPIKEELHEISEEDRTCSCCGNLRPMIGEERSSEFEIVPEHAVKIIHIRKKYGPCNCKDCSERGEGGILTASGPAKLIPGSDFTNRATAFFMVAKYNDALPFYRMAKIVGRSGLEVTRAGLSNHAIAAGRAIADIIDLMNRDLAKSPVLLMDETTVQVLRDENKSGDKKSYMWVACGYYQGKPIHRFAYNPSRSGAFAETLLKDFTGFYIQTDGYDGYNRLDVRNNLTHVGCFAHIRRKFVSAWETAGKTGMAVEAIDIIAKLYRIESELRKLLERNRIDEATFALRRNTQAPPVLEEFRDWLIKSAVRVVPQSALGKAISYAQSIYPKASRYIEHPLLTPDTNRVENAIRPFVIGRKNWLFSGSPRGAHASAGLYSLIETAKANGHEPYAYLSWLFDRLPLCKTLEEKELLLPYRVSPDNIVKTG